MVYTFPSLAFYCSYANNVGEKLFVQICIGFVNKQIEVAGTSKYVALVTSIEVKDALILAKAGYSFCS